METTKINIENIVKLKSEIEEYNVRFNKSESGRQDEMIERFSKLSEINEDNIIAVAALINTLYSTHIYPSDFKSLIQQIINVNDLKNRLNNGDIPLVTEISKVGGKEYLSFASKFCAFFNNTKYPIYDKISRKVLSDINKKYGFTNRFCKDKIPYDRFFTIYNAFISAFDLQNYTYRQIDKFLWGKGKDLEEAKRENN